MVETGTVKGFSGIDSGSLSDRQRAAELSSTIKKDLDRIKRYGGWLDVRLFVQNAELISAALWTFAHIGED
jgi:hypothetical protein